MGTLTRSNAKAALCALFVLILLPCSITSSYASNPINLEGIINLINWAKIHETKIENRKAESNTTDSDCDGVPDALDQCPGGDDSVDTDNDGIPDCVDWDGFDALPEEWKCGNNNTKVVICHVPQGNPDNANTLCVSSNAAPTHIADGDYLGPCMVVSCEGGGNDCCFPGVLTDNTLTGDGNLGNELSVNISNDANNQLTLGSDGALYVHPDGDTDPANELQTLGRSGNDVSLSPGGGAVSIEDDDSDPANELNTSLLLNGNTLELTDAGGTLNVDLSALSGAGDQDWLKLNNAPPTLITDDIYTNGKVGINTSTPNSELEVKGLVGAERITVGNTGVTNGAKIHIAGSSNVDILFDKTNGRKWNLSNDGFNMVFQNTTDPHPPALKIGYRGTSTINLPMDNQIGLDINGSNPSYVGLQLHNTSSNGNNWFFRSVGSSSNVASGSLVFDAGASTVNRRFVITPNTEVGINYGFPGAQLHVRGKDNSSGSSNFLLENQLANILVDVKNNGNVGIGTSSPTNRLDVDPGVSGISGLTLSGLKNNNPNGKVLSIDDVTGDVILVDKDAEDADWYEVGTTNAPDAITDHIFTHGNVGIGTSSPSTSERLLVIGKTRLERGPSGVTINSGRKVLEIHNNQDNFLWLATPEDKTSAIYSSHPGAGIFSAGIEFNNRNSNVNNPNGITFKTNVGGTYGEIAMQIREDKRVGIGFTDANNIMEKLHVAGNIFADGGIFITSDKRFKKDVKPLENALDRINKLEGVRYQFRTKEFQDRGFSDRPQLGVIAQNLEKVFPELVKTYEDDYKAVNYDGLIPVLIEGIKEQQQQIDKLENENTRIRKEMDELKRIVKELKTEFIPTGKIPNRTRVDLGGGQSIILDQNAPNPFKERTTIGYVVPEKVKDAQIFIFDLNGQIMKKVQLQAGEGTLEVFASNLSSGMYSYSLVIDGKVVDTKMMVVSK